MSETPQKTLGKYQIQGELGKGAMGVVYRGFDPALEREVAIKVMGSATVSDPELKKRFEQEAKASARLQHPNIVTVYDFGYDDEGAPYMAMELLKGQDLEQRIRKSPLTLQEKLDVVAQACRGLAHAHEHHIVHRDIKPANIFISESGIAKIMDFGVARLMQSSQTKTGTVLGTADYMSPEQIRGQKVDGRSDIFSAGVILYRLLTNKKPFTGENIQAVFFKVLNQEPPELVLPDGGGEMPELQAIVDKALMKNKDERYESAKDFAADIDDLMHLYQDILNENTVFDTMFDPSAMIDMEPGSDGSGRGRTSPTGRVLGRTSAASRTHRAGTAFPSGRTRTGATAAGRTATGTPTEMMRGTQVGTMSATRVGVGIPIQESSGGVLKCVGLVALLAAVGGGVFWFTQQNAASRGFRWSSSGSRPTDGRRRRAVRACREVSRGRTTLTSANRGRCDSVRRAEQRGRGRPQRTGQRGDGEHASDLFSVRSPRNTSSASVVPQPAPSRTARASRTLESPGTKMVSRARARSQAANRGAIYC